jgi:UDP-glucose 4-epimerase
MALAWVIGEGGLLGSSLKIELARDGRTPFSPSSSFAWGNAAELTEQFAIALKQFEALANKEDRWEIYWAAGTGNMHSKASDLKSETKALAMLVKLIQGSTLDMSVGTFQFSSSAGAIYAGSSEQVITEDSPIAPINPYALEKLEQEKLIAQLQKCDPRFTILISRISSVFGRRKKKTSEQGLLGQMAEKVVRNEVIHIYVPLETLRDYIHVDDAARAIVSAVHLAQSEGGQSIKIIAAQSSYSIAQIIAMFKKIGRRHVRVVSHTIESSKYYRRGVRFESKYLLDKASFRVRPVLVGIAQLLENELLQFARTHHHYKDAAS